MERPRNVLICLLLGLGITTQLLHAEAHPLIYIANARSNSVWVIDGHTDTVMPSIPVGQQPIGVAVSPDGKPSLRRHLASFSRCRPDTEVLPSQRKQSGGE